MAITVGFGVIEFDISLLSKIKQTHVAYNIIVYHVRIVTQSLLRH